MKGLPNTSTHDCQCSLVLSLCESCSRTTLPCLQGYTSLFLHPYVPTPLCSSIYTPMFLHPYVPTPLCSDNLCSYTPMFLQPMFLHPYVPTPLCSYTLCSYTTVFLHPYVPTPLYSFPPPPPYIPTLFTRSALGKWN